MFWIIFALFLVIYLFFQDIASQKEKNNENNRTAKDYDNSITNMVAAVGAAAMMSFLITGIINFVDVLVPNDTVRDYDVGGNPPSSNDEEHFVNPHWVDEYERSDGTQVDGYWRDGDGDTSVDRGVEEGGGWMQGNPSGDR